MLILALLEFMHNLLRCLFILSLSIPCKSGNYVIDKVWVIVEEQVLFFMVCSFLLKLSFLETNLLLPKTTLYLGFWHFLTTLSSKVVRAYPCTAWLFHRKRQSWWFSWQSACNNLTTYFHTLNLKFPSFHFPIFL